MTCNDIYLSALGKMGERPSVPRNDDYAERAPYILGSVLSDLSSLNGQYLSARGEEGESFEGSYIALTDDFPLHPRFAGVVSDYLASLLTIDEDEAVSDKFFDAFCHGVAKITAEIPAERQKILDVYA